MSAITVAQLIEQLREMDPTDMVAVVGPDYRPHPATGVEEIFTDCVSICWDEDQTL